MGAFELKNNSAEAKEEVQSAAVDHRRVKDECIIAFKVYDSCRQQDCLTADQIGPARAAECVRLGDEHINESDIIEPPANAATVTIDRLRVKKIIIVEKEPNPFRNGFWDIDIKFVFEYRLTFREADGDVIGSVKANSIFNKKVTLFGSVGNDLVISTDLFKKFDRDSATLDSDPFVLVEAKAVALSAELRFPRRRGFSEEDAMSRANEVLVTIGLFSIIKLFRIVNLNVQSKGFCIPDECEEISPISPCDFFEQLDFPMDVFAPPQRAEFLAGISGNIPFRDKRKPCGCDD